MKSRRSILPVLALLALIAPIAFGVEPTDLLVRPAEAHDGTHNANTHSPSTHGTGHEPLLTPEETRVLIRVLIPAISLYEWLDSVRWSPPQEQAAHEGEPLPTRRDTSIPLAGTAPSYCTLCCETHDPRVECDYDDSCPQRQRRP